MKLSSELISFCRIHEKEDVYALALQASSYPNIDMDLAIRQIKGRQIVKTKLPSWYANERLLYPIHLSLEQASSESTALYKQGLCSEGEAMIDLTGGLGVDISFLSKLFQKAIYVEQQESLSLLAEHNFGELGLHNIEVVNGEAHHYLEQIEKVFDLIYIDPARRDGHGKKIFFIEDCSPNLLEIQDLLRAKAKTVMIKLSPMLDISLALSKLKSVSSVHIVGVDNEVKELLFITDQNYSGEVEFHCANIRKARTDKFVYYASEENNSQMKYASQVKTYLYEPNASILKSGAYKLVAERFNLEKLHPSSHLYTSDVRVEDFPGRAFRVKTVSSLNKAELKKKLDGIDKINITVRNFPMSVDALRKKLKVAEGGNDYLFATTLSNNQKILVFCEKI